MDFSEAIGIEVKFKSFKSKAKGLRKGNVIGIRIGLSQAESEYTLAHELAHVFLHSDKGNTITNPKHDEFEEQDDRAANMLLIYMRWQEQCQGIGQN